MPSFNSSFDPSVNYFATPENHTAIEMILGVLDSWERGHAADLIFQIVVTHRIVKGKSILDTLRLRYPDADQEPVAPDDQEALLMRTYTAEALADDDRLASGIYDEMTAVEQMTDGSPETVALTLEVMEENIDRALQQEKVARRDTSSSLAVLDCG